MVVQTLRWFVEQLRLLLGGSCNSHGNLRSVACSLPFDRPARKLIAAAKQVNHHAPASHFARRRTRPPPSHP
jgi:hypothetical protein